MRKFLFFLGFIVISFSQLHAQCPKGHEIFFPDGTISVSFCQGNAPSHLIVNSDIRGFPKAYVLTNSDDEILWMGNSPKVPLVGVRSGTYHIFSVVYAGRLWDRVEENIHEARISSYCWTLSDNFIRLTISEVDVEDLSFADGTFDKEVCSPSSNPKEISLDFPVTSNDFVIVLVGTDNRIFQLFHDVDFVPASSISRDLIIYGVGFEGELIGEVGDYFNPNDFIDGCYGVSNPIELSLISPDGGSISYANGDSFLWLCPEDSMATAVQIETDAPDNQPFYFFVTDMNGNIQLIERDEFMDLSGLTEGTYHISAAVSYSPSVYSEGDSLDKSNAFSDDCFDWAINSIEFRFEGPEGGNISFESNASDYLSFCPDNRPDSIVLSTNGNDGPGFAYVLFKDGGEVVEVKTEPVFYDLPDFGLFSIMGFSYFGDIVLSEGDDIFEDELSSSCYTPSTNQLYVAIDDPSESRITWNQGSDTVSFCSGDGEPFPVSVDHDSGSFLQYGFILLDANGLILDFSLVDSLDLEGSAEGLMSIRGISIADPETIQAGNHVDSVPSNCYKLSDNQLYVQSISIDGGEVFFSAGRQEIKVCEPGVGGNSVRVFRNTTSPNYVTVLTDSNNNYLRHSESDTISTNGLLPGEYRIWGVGFLTSVDLVQDTSIFDHVLSAECYSISNQSISLIIDNPEGGNITLGGIIDAGTYCLGEAPDEIIDFESSTNSSLNYAYILLNSSNLVVEILDSSQLNLADLEAGIHRYIGLSFGGSLLLNPGDNPFNPDTDIATVCYELSSNVVGVNIYDMSGGEISFNSGLDQKVICSNPGSPTIPLFSNNVAGESYLYLLLDQDSTLLDYTTGNELEVDDLENGEYTILGLSAVGIVSLEIGESITDQNFTNQCHELSENSLALIVASPEGGRVTTSEGDTSIVLSIDPDVPDSIYLENTSLSPAYFTYVITDDEDLILGFFDQNLLVFSNTAFPNLRVYGLSYTGNLQLTSGMIIDQVNPSDDCWDWSENHLEIILLDGLVENRNSMDRAKYSSTGGAEINLTSANPVSDFLTFEVEISSEELNEGLQISIYDVSGKVFLQQNHRANYPSNHFSKDVSGLPSGMYILRVQLGSHSDQLLFVKL